MKPLYILVVEDEPEVAEAVAATLAPIESDFPVEVAGSAEDARDVVESAASSGRQPALVLCDHVLPGMQGVDFLIELAGDPATASCKKILLTGQAGLESTIQAVNRAGLDHYIAKPWDDADLVATSRRLLTDFVIENADEDLIGFMRSLDGGRIAEAVRKRNEGL